jgi:hypothetical protein
MLLTIFGPGPLQPAIPHKNRTFTGEETEEITSPEKQSTIGSVAFGATSNKQARSKRHLVSRYRSFIFPSIMPRAQTSV